MRIGFGSDIHRLIPERKLILGGIAVDSPVGPEAHSDGDVLIHAVIDALLGAAALGDIGELFPPEETRWKDADSCKLLSQVVRLVEKAGFMIINLDATIHLEHPRLRPYKESIARNLAKVLGISADAVSVKAKTGEQMGPVGRSEAVRAEAAVLLGAPEPDIWV